MIFLGRVATEGFEDSAYTFMARIRGNSGALIEIATISSIACKVFDLNSTTPSTAVATPTVTVSTAVYDTLQTGVRWTRDSTASPGPDGSVGYNFLHQVPGSAFAGPGHVFDVDYIFTPTTGEPIVQGFRHTTTSIYSS